MYTLKDSHPVASSGENGSSTDSQQWEESHSIASYEVEGGAWVPTGEGTWFLKLSMKMGTSHSAVCLSLSSSAPEEASSSSSCGEWQEVDKLKCSGSRRLASDSDDVHSPGPSGSLESDNSELLLVCD